MGLEAGNYSYIFLIAMGIYCIFRGVMLLITGKLQPREEAGLRGFSENGIRKYKILSAVMNIVGGVLVILITVVKLLNLVDRGVFVIAALAIIVVMLVVYFLIRNSCKNAK